MVRLHGGDYNIDRLCFYGAIKKNIYIYILGLNDGPFLCLYTAFLRSQKYSEVLHHPENQKFK